MSAFIISNFFQPNRWYLLVIYIYSTFSRSIVEVLDEVSMRCNFIYTSRCLCGNFGHKATILNFRFFTYKYRNGLEVSRSLMFYCMKIDTDIPIVFWKAACCVYLIYIYLTNRGLCRCKKHSLLYVTCRLGRQVKAINQFWEFNHFYILSNLL